ncbi:MerR family transcriptional regulator [Planctobacterium marinum]|uniref:HTH merR-type domain-containing protein n=1 Tax=Planctobacterium marinum TaxID=1631968 RepID=A0AA48HR07_9ALTE|nr:hypothetical protein MACH26_26280 [Planctobacterium marinum]
MIEDKAYTVSQVSEMTGVSVKALHYYHEKQLLVPFRQPSNGYRIYTESHLIRLQQILIYRELDFGVDEIKSLLNAEEHSVLQLLASQKSLLLERQRTISKMINTLEVTMDGIKGKQIFDILFEDIPKEKTERWDNMARERMGDEQMAQSMGAFAGIAETDMRSLKEESDRITIAFAQTIGQPIESDFVQQLTKEHYQLANKMLQLVQKAQGETELPDLGYEDYKAMADSVDEQDVHELCEHYGEGYAEHARQAMIYFAEKQLKES